MAFVASKVAVKGGGGIVEVVIAVVFSLVVIV